jgi:bacteriorhodopsin
MLQFSTRLLKATTYVSIAVQMTTGLFGVYGLKRAVDPEHEALKNSLQFEMAAQAIALAFYFWLIFHFNVPTMAATRYRDWAFSTPLMLFAVMLYFKYEDYRERGVDTSTVWQDFLRDNSLAIAVVLVCNGLMLASGYLGETGMIDKKVALILGFVAFAIAFYVIYAEFASKSEVGTRVFSVIAFVWGLYGAVYFFPAIPKNMALNGLDVVAKNMFGLYLTHKVVVMSR